MENEPITLEYWHCDHLLNYYVNLYVCEGSKISAKYKPWSSLGGAIMSDFCWFWTSLCCLCFLQLSKTHLLWLRISRLSLLPCAQCRRKSRVPTVTAQLSSDPTVSGAKNCFLKRRLWVGNSRRQNTVPGTAWGLNASSVSSSFLQFPDGQEIHLSAVIEAFSLHLLPSCQSPPIFTNSATHSVWVCSVCACRRVWVCVFMCMRVVYVHMCKCEGDVFVYMCTCGCTWEYMGGWACVHSIIHVSVYRYVFMCMCAWECVSVCMGVCVCACWNNVHTGMTVYVCECMWGCENYVSMCTCVSVRECVCVKVCVYTCENCIYVCRLMSEFMCECVSMCMIVSTIAPREAAEKRTQVPSCWRTMKGSEKVDLQLEIKSPSLKREQWREVMQNQNDVRLWGRPLVGPARRLPGNLLPKEWKVKTFYLDQTLDQQKEANQDRLSWGARDCRQTLHNYWKSCFSEGPQGTKSIWLLAATQSEQDGTGQWDDTTKGEQGLLAAGRPLACVACRAQTLGQPLALSWKAQRGHPWPGQENWENGGVARLQQ